MPDTFTPNYNLTKVEVGASADTWGGKLNGNADLIDTALDAAKDVADAAMPKAGGTFIGAVSFSGSATFAGVCSFTNSLETTKAADVGKMLFHRPGVALWEVGGYGHGSFFGIRLNGVVAPAIAFGTNGICYIPSGLLDLNGVQPYTPNNDGAGSGLDADLLDGQHAAAFALVGHTHSYLPLTGGEVTGDLTRAGAGDYLHHVDPAMSSGRVFVTEPGAADPTASNGDFWYELTAL